MNKWYEGTLYRPPSEANSLIVQSTIGCSQNQCTFCTMYKDKVFRIIEVETVTQQINELMIFYRQKIRKIFLADGDALIRNVDEQLQILQYIQENYSFVEQVSCYASPRSILNKTPEELFQLRRAGLKLVYLGLESGSDEVLKKVGKGVQSIEMVQAAKKIHQAGIHLSVTAILGLGGKELSKEHGVKTGKILSLMKPEYIGLLTLMVPEDSLMRDDILKGKFELLDSKETLEETKEILIHTDSEGSIFRSNHASNYLDLRGTLNKDKKKLIQQIDFAIEGKAKLKEEYCRGL